MCPDTAKYVSSYGYICPRTAGSRADVLILLYMCAMDVSSYGYICVLILQVIGQTDIEGHIKALHICVLILLHMCPHTATYVSSYCR
jgi:hypothetical protein